MQPGRQGLRAGVRSARWRCRTTQKEARMKRFHVNVSVGDIAEGVRFYSALFATEPTVRKADYAKWMLDDPRINFAISQRGYPIGGNHLGFQSDSAAELPPMRAPLPLPCPPLLEPN